MFFAKDRVAAHGCDSDHPEDSVMQKARNGVVILVVLAAAAGNTAAGVAVPNVVGLTQAEADTAIADAGLAVGTITEGHGASVPAQRVMRQDPVPGTPVASGSAVNIVVSVGWYREDPVWPWGTNPGTGAEVMSLREAQFAIRDNTGASLFPAPYIFFPSYLDPDTGDANGDSWIIMEPLSFSVSGNGWADCAFELVLIEEALRDTTLDIPAHDGYAGLSHQQVLHALNVNAEQFEADLGAYWGMLCDQWNGWPQVMLTHMLFGTGDTVFSDYQGDPAAPNRIDASGSAGFIKMVVFALGKTGALNNAVIDLDKYARMPGFFAANDDADGDGAVNSCEHRWVVEDFPAETAQDMYALWALDPDKTPAACYCAQTSCGLRIVAQSPDATYHSGESMTLFVEAADSTGPITYAWDKDGTPIENADEGTYSKTNLAPEDSGTYRCTVTDTAKWLEATDAMEAVKPGQFTRQRDASKATVAAFIVVQVLPKVALPAGTAVAAGVLTGIVLALGGLAAGRCGCHSGRRAHHR